MQNDQRIRKSIIFYLFMLVMLIAMAAPAYAAVEMVEFRVFSLSDRVRLEWETAKEYNLIGFQLFCKQEAETDAEYHPIGFPIPGKGTLEKGAVYFTELRDLQPGVSYCFRCRRSSATASRARSLKSAAMASASPLRPQ